MIIDVWMQHPTVRFLGHEMFDSLRRWTGQQVPEDQPSIEATLAAMDQADVDVGPLSAWSAPRQPLGTRTRRDRRYTKRIQARRAWMPRRLLR